MFNEKNVLNYYMHLNNLCDEDLDEVERLRVLSEKEFKLTIDKKKEIKNIIEIESYNYLGANSLIVWYLVKNGIEVESRETSLKSLMEMLVPKDTLNFLLNNLDEDDSVSCPDGVVFKNNTIQRNFLKARTIFLSTGGIQLNMGKERILKLLCEAVNMDILRLMRYINKLQAVVSNRNETNIKLFTCIEAKQVSVPMSELEKLKRTLSYLTEEYIDENNKCKTISV